jgi:hypothetical protein
MDLRFIHPYSAVIAGPSSAGKSVFVERLIKNGLRNTNVEFSDILWCYSEWHPDSKQLGKNVRFQKGLDNLERSDQQSPRLIVVDDLMREAGNSVVDLFTRGSHHTNTSVIFITQNMFHQGQGQRSISLNSHYMVLFKNPRDSAQIAYLARQIYPSNPKYIQEAYTDATKRPFGYIVLDLKQQTPEDCRCRTNIFGEEPPGYEIVYKPKLTKKV